MAHNMKRLNQGGCLVAHSLTQLSQEGAPAVFINIIHDPQVPVESYTFSQ